MFDVKVNGDLEAWAKDAAKAATDAVMTEVGAVTRDVYADAKARWPVRKPERWANHPVGYSKSRLGTDTKDEDGFVVGRVANDSGYAYFIRSKRFDLPPGSNGVKVSRDGKRHAWTALVREPAERRSAGLRDRLGVAIVTAVERVR